MIPGLGSQAAETGRPAGRFGRILIADEALPVRRYLLEILQRMGVAEGDVTVAAETEVALALFMRDKPAVVFTEFLGMHCEDGLEIIHEMLDRDPGVRVVLVTAESDDCPEVRAAVRAGIFAVIHKPLRHEKVRAILSDLESEQGGIERFR